MGVQYSLWGGSVFNLGTERHRKKYFDDIDRYRLPGERGGGGGQMTIPPPATEGFPATSAAKVVSVVVGTWANAHR
jgi:hypothetical protein